MAERGLLEEIIRAGLARAVRADAAAAAAEIAARHEGVAAVLFYGSCLRGDDGIADLYILTDSARAFHRGFFAAAAHRLLPPAVLFLPSNAQTNAGFKAAVITRRQFRARMRPGGIDSTVWARFCQPSALAWCRDDDARAWLGETLAEAAAAAVHWAVRLGPAEGRPVDAWTALFRCTYDSELRAEGAGRATDIYGFDAARYDALIGAETVELTWNGDGSFRRILDNATLAAARRAWSCRRLPGKVLNALRLVKALFTFRGGVDYIVWKLERHSGQRVALTPWQKRHPLLAAPFVLASLVRRGIVK
jgi:hypothetical protein